MKGVTQRVWSILDDDVSCQQHLKKGVINVSALAQTMIDEFKLSATQQAVISAIRRYPIKKRKAVEMGKLLRLAKIQTKTQMSAITWRQGPPTDDLQRLFDAGVLGSKVDLRLLKGSGVNTAILPKTKAQKLLKILPKTRIINTRHDLSEISIELSKHIYRTPGFVATLSNVLSAQGISMEIVIAMNPTISFFIKEEDLAHAHGAILGLTKQKL